MKNVLIISHNSLSLHSNNGKTLANLFVNWSSEAVSQLYFQDEIPESTKFTNFFRVRDIDIFKNKFFFCEHTGGTVRPESKVLSHYESASYLKIKIISVFRKFDLFKRFFRDALYSRSAWSSPTLMSWLKSVRPSSIFFVGGNYIFSFRIALALSEKLKIPLDIYITDDYVITPNSKGLLLGNYQARLLSTYVEAFGKARNVFVIGEDMSLAFEKCFARKFLPFMNCVDVPDWNCVVSKSVVAASVIDIVYAGGLHLGRHSSICRFAVLASKAASALGKNISLNVYSVNKPDPNVLTELTSAGVTFAGSLSSSDISSRLSTANFVLHVESFDEAYRNLTKLSVSTKIPEYLISGSCVIAYGPSELSSIRLIGANELGLVIDDFDDDSSTVEKLSRLFSSDAIVSSFVVNGYNFAAKNFDSNEVRFKFQSLFY